MEFCMPNIPPYIPINTAWFLDHRIWKLPARSPVFSMRLIQKTQPRTPPKLKQWPRHSKFSRNLWVVKSRPEFHYMSCEMKAWVLASSVHSKLRPRSEISEQQRRLGVRLKAKQKAYSYSTTSANQKSLCQHLHTRLNEQPSGFSSGYWVRTRSNRGMFSGQELFALKLCSQNRKIDFFFT